VFVNGGMQNRYPQHKLLSHYLLIPGYLAPDAEDVEPEAEEITLGFGALDERLVNNLHHRDESLEPPGPLAGAGTDLTPRGTLCRKPKVSSPDSDKSRSTDDALSTPAVLKG
jgi:hypothetical protein